MMLLLRFPLSVLARRGGAALALLLTVAAAFAQMPPAPVRYTEARAHAVLGSITLPGSVESPASSVVASEVAGRVVEFRAREGSPVRKGEAIVRLATEEIESRLAVVIAQQDEARARLDLAERNLVRAKQLLAEEVIPQQDLDAATSELHAWKGRTDTYTAEAARLRLDLERSTVKAPFGGVVVADRTEIGEWLGIGDPVVELISVGELDVRIEVPERHYRNLAAGAPATVTFDALPGVKAEGRVKAIIPRADSQSRTFPVKVRIANPGGAIGAGMLARVSLPVGEPYQATLVPKDALITQGPDRFVWVLNADNSVAMTPVEPGDGVGPWIVVKGSVLPGQKVITRGNERIMPGQQVQGQPQEYPLP